MFGGLVLVILACIGVVVLVNQAAIRPQVPGTRLATFLASAVLLGLLTAAFLMRGKIFFAIPSLVGAVACGLQYQRLAGKSGTNASGGDMDRVEALSVLGLAAGASADSIKAAHRRLIEQLHPDKGGNDYLAAKINRARDILLKDLT
jgi:DnaJ-domain-containing protein 1